MIRKKRFIKVALILLGIFASLTYNLNYNREPFSYENNEKSEIRHLNNSDVAGTDLYAENIDVFVAGNKSIIKQSLFSNDTSILPQFDTRDPAFFKCNLHFSVSNGIIPDIFPTVITENNIPLEFGMSFNSFSGFLYYEEDLPQSDVQIRAERALEILKRKFEIDLILVPTTNPYFFPFVGHFPDWRVYLREVLGNLPMDGYWKALDVNRLTSNEYLNSKHLSSTFLLINSLDILEKDFISTIDQIDFNLESLDISYLESFDVGTIFEQFTNILTDFPTLFGNFTDLIGTNQTSDEDMSALIDVLGTFSLSNKSYYTNLMIQYEGDSDGIKEIEKNRYEFNLWNALNYKKGALRPSEKIFIALLGAFMSNININILCTEITEVTPKYYELYTFLLEQIETILFYAEIDFDVDSLKDYSLELFWTDFEGIKRNFVRPINLNEPNDYVNFLSIFGLQGFEGLPAGILNPINNFAVEYVVENAEPTFLIKKDLIGNNASYGVYNTFSFNITAENVGNNTIWGNPTHIPLTLDDAFALIVGPAGSFLNLDEDLKDAIWDIVRVEYSGQYRSLIDFFNYDEDPRIFYFDSAGIGIIDYYYPNLLNITNLLPYNEKMDEVITIMTSSYQQLLNSLNAIGVSVNDLRTIFGNQDSIWNTESWKIEPGKKINYEFSNFSIENYDSFSEFYHYNFFIRDTFPRLPNIISGVSIEGTAPNMALENDNQSWIVKSEEKYVGFHEIDIQFLFKNITNIDLKNNSLDRILIILNLTDLSNNINLEVFNYSTETFQDLSPFLSSETNSSIEYSFERNEGTLEWIFDPYSRTNHSILIRLSGSDSDSFNISINNFDIQFAYRDVNLYEVLGSRIIYSSFSGNIEYIKRSNSIALSTYNMASVVAYAYLDSYNSANGELLHYHLTLQNIGSEIAKNVNITILLPGIVQQYSNFSLKKNTLNYFFPELIPKNEKKLNFSFYSPNTAKIGSVLIEYENKETIKNINSTKITSEPNEIVFTSPVDYKTRFPFLKIVEISYNTSVSNPDIGELFNLTVTTKSLGAEGFNVSNLIFHTGDQYGDLIPYNISHSVLNIAYNQSNSFIISLYKKDWKGYYYPSINHFNCPESRLIQIKNSQSILLGKINFTIVKSIDRNNIEIGDILTVNITIVNTGTICVKNISLDDTVSFTDINFELINGNLVNEITCLHSNQSISFIYQIRAKTQAVVTLKPAFIEQYYLNKVRYTSNEIQVKVNIPNLIQYIYILGPSLGVLLILIGFLWRRYKYNSKKYERQRYEYTLFQDKSSVSVLNIERTINDYFKSISDKKSSKFDLKEIPREKSGDVNK
jgi:hypothetical protein